MAFVGVFPVNASTFKVGKAGLTSVAPTDYAGIAELEESRGGLENDLLDPSEVEVKEVSLKFTPKMKPIIDQRERFDS
ncbi:hypothetical protein DSECCO2_551650 [anaerobic digester metagenome]